MDCSAAAGLVSVLQRCGRLTVVCASYLTYSILLMAICNLDVEESGYAVVAVVAVVALTERASVGDAELRNKLRDSFA